ncbi:hypothetical protein RJ639_030979, partial [Escallonia herrerae]
MDAPPPTPPSSTPTSTASVTTHSDPMPPLPTAKLRLMCSYGGQIVPRPNTNSLCYVGGETRIVSVDRRATAATFSALSAHFSRTLFNGRPFALKYQLPNEDLDALISVTTDEDLQNMLEEHDRIGSSSTPSRIRLFLFPSSTPDSVGSVLLDPKSESWFCDALKGTRIMQRGQADGSGAGTESGLMGRVSSVESLSNSGGDGKPGLDFGSVPESMVLETSSSFGSTGSSSSMSNVPPIGVVEDGGTVKLALPNMIESDNSVANAVPYPRTGTYQDHVVHVTSADMKVSPTNVESERNIMDTSYMTPMQKTVQSPGYQLPQVSDWKQHQPEVQYIQASGHYIPQYATGMLPVPSYYSMYHPQMQQQQHGAYLPSQPHQIYVLPLRPNQPYSMSVPCNLNETTNVASSRPPLHTNPVMISSQVAYKEGVTAVPNPESAKEVYRMVPAAPFDTALYNQYQQQYVAPPEMHRPSQPMATSSTANAGSDNQFDDDLAYAQIYKSQPPAPPLATSLLPEASTQTYANKQ